MIGTAALRRFTLALVALGALAIPASSTAAGAAKGPGAGARFVSGELIVLLDHGPAAPTPEAVVESARAERPLPGGLGASSPVAARFLISQRLGGAARDLLLEDPDAPQAVLQRYVVLTYPPVVDLDRMIETLEVHPDVLWVGKNTLAQVSITEPNDPFFNDNPGGVTRPPAQHQWGSYSLKLHEAWDWARGHAYVGVVDTGLDFDHPDLRPFDTLGNFIGGNYRAHLSWDYGYEDADVDEGQQQGTVVVTTAGHGTHVSGIIGATPNNSKGVAGACWNCSLLVSKVSRLSSGGVNTSTAKTDIVEGINGAIANGAQVLNLSLGYRPTSAPNCTTTPLDAFCQAIALMETRDVVMAAAAGNDGGQASDWPASDSRVIGVGGIETDGTFWNDCPGTECGSNVDPNQIVAPAQSVYSTFYVGLPYAPTIGCSDSVDGTVDGYGLCTGTSMSSPYIAGSAGILRSVNPLLTKANVAALFTSNLENPVGWNTANGKGKPNVRAATQAALGKVNGVVLKNRLTPLFQLYSSVAEDFVYTTAPQMATGFQWSQADYWSPLSAPLVGGYGPYFPGGKTCSVGPCIYYTRASVYIFTDYRSPNASPLVPLYRMSFKGTFSGGPSNPNNADHTYAISAAEVKAFANAGYKLDGIEGYIYARCGTEPSCIPAGAVKLYRIYNPTIDDWVVIPESQVATFQANGYTMQYGSIAWIGYAYPNVDSDGDWLINGFETLVGTNPGAVDSDCDGKRDGAELLQYPYTDPKVGTC